MAIEFTDGTQLPLIERSDEEIAALRDGLARLIGERESEQLLKRAAVEEFNERIKEIDERISEVARVIREEEAAKS